MNLKNENQDLKFKIELQNSHIQTLIHNRDVAFTFILEAMEVNRELNEKLEALSKTDALSKIIDLQNALNSRLGLTSELLQSMKLQDKLRLIDMNCKSAIAEVIEIQESMGPTIFKPWKDRSVDMATTQEEIIDLFNFCINMLLASGLDTVEKITNACEAKWNKNMTRNDWDINKSGAV